LQATLAFGELLVKPDVLDGRGELRRQQLERFEVGGVHGTDRGIAL
jgi:hypothetical protein